jgi:hypothetical protein
MIVADNYHPLNAGSVLLVFLGGGTAVTITVDIFATVDGQTPPGRTITVPINERVVAGPFDPSIYNIKTGTYAGRMQVRTSAAGTSVAAITL